MLLEPAVQLALTGETGAVRVQDMEGEEMLASYAPIPGTECFVVEQESWGEVGAAAMGYGRWLVLILVLALVVPAVIVRTALTFITRPIKRLTEASEAMSRGEMHQIVDMPAAQELSDLPAPLIAWPRSCRVCTPASSRGCGRGHASCRP